MTKKYLFIGLVMLLILCHATIALGVDPRAYAHFFAVVIVLFVGNCMQFADILLVKS